MEYKKEIIAVLDPMCSWCWGFEPVLNQIREFLPQDTELKLFLGGLRGRGEQKWDTAFKEYLQSHWKNVAETTGQGFDFSLLEKKEFDYDTEPACRAVVSVRNIDKSRQFTFFHALQEAFYLRAEDITSRDVLAGIAEKEGIDKVIFLKYFDSEEMKEETKADGYRARSMGANVFPSLVFIDEEGHLFVLKGYRSFEQLKPFVLS